jgi:ApbE superfamily uncharacterized protein (UPF0280 family)
LIISGKGFDLFEMYEKRTYRNFVRTDDLVQFEVIVKETDLLIRAEKDLFREAKDSALKYRNQIETYIAMNPDFERSLIPIEEASHVPEIVCEMIRTSSLAGVGPMAAVAGAIAEAVSRDILPLSHEVIVENGGDIYLATVKERIIGIYAGSSPLSMKIGVVIESGTPPLGICTSSGTVGHSLSFGKADAVCVLSKSGALADAAATAIGNTVLEEKDIERGLERAEAIDGVTGVLIIVGEKMGIWGDLRIIKL